LYLRQFFFELPFLFSSKTLVSGGIEANKVLIPEACTTLSSLFCSTHP
jgi:hypothetical protein